MFLIIIFLFVFVPQLSLFWCLGMLGWGGGEGAGRGGGVKAVLRDCALPGHLHLYFAVEILG